MEAGKEGGRCKTTDGRGISSCSDYEQREERTVLHTHTSLLHSYYFTVTTCAQCYLQ